MITCDLHAPRHAFVGEAVRLACRLDGAPPLTRIPVRLALTVGDAERELAVLPVMTSSSGSGHGTARTVLGEAPGAVTVVATPMVDGRPGIADTAVVVLR